MLDVQGRCKAGQASFRECLMQLPGGPLSASGPASDGPSISFRAAAMTLSGTCRSAARSACHETCIPCLPTWCSSLRRRLHSVHANLAGQGRAGTQYQAGMYVCRRVIRMTAGCSTCPRVMCWYVHVFHAQTSICSGGGGGTHRGCAIVQGAA